MVSNAYGLRQRFGFLVSILLAIILFFLPRPAELSPQAWHVLILAITMALLWITEAIPIPVTSLIPLVFFPFLNIQPFTKVAPSYANSNIFLFMGGFFIAAAMQKWELHKRVALYLIYIIGTSRRLIILGFMVASAFLSMWISNTATVMMMYPIGIAVILQLVPNGAKGDNNKEFQTAMMLAIAYAASIGGIATLVGTPPNIVFTGSLSQLFPQAPEVSFVDWFLFGMLLLVCFLPISWFVLTRVVFKISSEKGAANRAVIADELKRLGPMSGPEKSVGIIFICTALAWITRKNLTIGGLKIVGWGNLLGVGAFVNDATVAMASAFLLFVIPAHFRSGRFLLDWGTAVKIPWGILILFGGGIALAGGFRESGLAAWFGAQLSLFSALPIWLMILVVATLLTFLTEVTSNTATTTLFMPILASTAVVIGVHPFLLMVPATISASCAFMLPVATPPNAIIFGSGYVSIPEMARAGIILNIIGILLVTLITWFFLMPILGIEGSGLPAWAH